MKFYHRKTRFAAALTAMALLLCLFALPAMAEAEVEPTAAPAPVPTAAAAEEPAAAATAEPQATPTDKPTAARTAAPTASAQPGATATPEPNGDTATPTATPAYYTDGVYVQAVTVTDLAGGEMTTVNWNDHVNLVMRVVDHSSARNHVTAEEIVARINSSVFQFTGTGEISQLFEESDQNGPYYSYVLLFRDVIYVGGGSTVPVTLSYLDSSMAMQQFDVSIGQCVDKDPNDPSKAKTPGLVIRASSYGTEAVTAGSPFTLSLTVFATSGTEAVNDVIVTVTLPKGVTLTGGSLTTYVGGMSVHGTRDVTFPVLPAANFTDGVADITVTMTGTGALSGAAISGSSVISVPILQPDRFELGDLQTPDTLTVGETNSVTLNFVNKGKNPVGNLEAKLTGANLGDNEQSQYIGNINAGTENSVDFDLTPTAEGPYSGTITLSYEAQDGSVKTVSESFSGTVEAAMVMDDSMYQDMGAMQPEATGPSPFLIGSIIAAVIAAVVVLVLVLRAKRKKKALDQLEEADDDFTFEEEQKPTAGQAAGKNSAEGNNPNEGL